MFRHIRSLIITAVAALSLGVSAFCDDDEPGLKGPIDQWGKIDTVYADLSKVSDKVWQITINWTNDQPLIAFTIPLHYTAGKARLVADSAIFANGRASTFDVKSFRCDTAIQVMMVGMIGAIGPAKKSVDVGSGPLATIYISSLDVPIQNLKIDTCTAAPNNTLMAIADQKLLGIPADSLTPEVFQKLILIPEFRVREPKK